METTERINVLRHQITILETGYAGIISGQIVDMRDYPNYTSDEKTGLIEKDCVNNYLFPLKEELNQEIIKKYKLLAEEDYTTTPISVLAYITELENKNKSLQAECEHWKRAISNLHSLIEPKK
jgi:hypothetical protein